MKRDDSNENWKDCEREEDDDLLVVLQDNSSSANNKIMEEKVSLLESKFHNVENLLLLLFDHHRRNHTKEGIQQEENNSTMNIIRKNGRTNSRTNYFESSSSQLTLDTYTQSADNWNADESNCNENNGVVSDHHPQGEDQRSSRYPTSKQSKMSQSSTVIEEDLNEEDDYKHLSQDTFSLMLLANAFTKQWLFGLGVFLLQIGLLSMIVMDQFSSSKDSSPFDVPYKVDPIVHVGQLLAIFLSLTTQTDLVMAIMTFMLLWTERRIYWTKLIKVPEDASLWVWMTRIAFPICCEFTEGACVLFTTFVIVIQSSNVIDLFKDFAAMQLISELDNMMFWLALHGYVGAELATSAKQAVKIKIHDNITKSYGGVPLRTIILMVICLAMIGCWGFFVHGQVSGKFFALKYPKCLIDDKEILKLNNGVCDGGYLNTVACGFDDGDCITFNLGYPNCKIDEPTKIGNGVCDQEYNDEDCLYDGDDCCPLNANDFSENVLYGDGKCHGGIFNTEHCEFDGGDCVKANQKYPDCPVLILTNKMLTTFDSDNPFPALGDGRCDGGIFNTKECGWDDGDCLICNAVVPDPSKIGDGHCDGGLYLETTECNNDGHDCSFFVKNFPDCHVPEPERLGNGHCDGNVYLADECGIDAGDCSSCNVTHLLWVGDGICDGNQYLTTGCSMDGGDCAACLSSGADPAKLGDGICHVELNTTACGWDGNDCLEKPKLAPCIVENEDWLGDGFCDGGAYNTEACGYDGGDCLECNSLVPDPTKIGDGTCDNGPYNELSACNEDGKDCRNFNKNYPNCRVHFPEKIGDGICDGTIYFTPECKNDGGDCDECVVEFNRWVGDGFCDGGEYLTASCSMDGGDCNLCMQLIPFIDPKRIGDGKCDVALNITECGYDGHDCVEESVKCNVLIPENLGNGVCDGGEYNTPMCSFDNGDCIECDALVPDPDKVGNGKCDGGIYMTHPSCFQDGGDCTAFLQRYPSCQVPDPEKVGDGICDGALYFKEACGWDGGDCQSCAAENIEWIGDGICNGGIYLSSECNMDGGDCDECLAASRTDPKNLGDGYCDIELNTTLCGYDGGDCLGSDLCNVPIKDWLGDSFCDGGIYNTAKCGFDGGDCSACNALVRDPTKIGNGYCNGGLYMTLPECFLDGQDCKEYKKLYPDCLAPQPEKVGDGHCDGILYNTTECGWDGNDCIVKDDDDDDDDVSPDDDADESDDDDADETDDDDDEDVGD